MADAALPHDHHDAHGHDDHGHGHLVENNFLGLPNLKLAMWAFLGSECMFFGSLIAVYFFYHGLSIDGPLPADVFSVTVTSISTFVLLASSFTMAMAVDNMKTGKVQAAKLFLLSTAFLGLIFVGFQVYEFQHFWLDKGLALQTSLFASSFYVMTGTHGTHVTVGIIWLLMVWSFIHRGKIKAGNYLPVEVAGLYWHFVDIVWIIIFTFVYLLEF